VVFTGLSCECQPFRFDLLDGKNFLVIDRHKPLESASGAYAGFNDVGKVLLPIVEETLNALGCTVIGVKPTKGLGWVELT
jgi:hypothetical protein